MGQCARNIVWTDQRREFVRELWATGSSASKIVQQLREAFGIYPTRSGIIGLCNRNKWPHPVLPGRPRGPRKPRLPSSITRLLDPAVPPADFLGIKFMDLQRGQCRYPRGEDVITFCGQPVQAGSSYCPSCRRMTIQRPVYMTQAEREIRLRQYNKPAGASA